MTLVEKIRIVMIRRNGITINQLAFKMNIPAQTMYNKFKRNNFTEKELLDIADALNCDLIINFKMRDNGDIV